MTNVSGSTEKNRVRKLLIKAAYLALERDGWQVAKVRGRVLKISKKGTTKQVAIRTSQDTWLAFPRTPDDASWATLSDVDMVVASSVDVPDDPRVAQVHFLDAAELVRRFDRAYEARLAAGHTIPVGRGVWVSLYRDEANEPVQRVGAGIGNLHPPVARIPLDEVESAAGKASAEPQRSSDPAIEVLSIAEAKLRLAKTFGVDPANIKITVEG